MEGPLPDAESIARSRVRQARAAVDRGLHHPAVELSIVVAILLSVLTLLLEVALQPGSAQRDALRLAGDAFTAVFAVELTMRFWVAPSKRRFFQRYFLDILAVLPLARPLRLLRVLLLLRLFRAGVLLNRRLTVFGGMLRGTLNELTLVLTLSSTVVLVGAVTLHMAPGNVQFEGDGIEGALWYSLLTLLGAEPIAGVPHTQFGLAVTLALMLGGMTVFGVFVGTVSAGMVTVLSKRMEVNEMELDELSQHVVVCGWNHAGPALVRELFGPGSPPSQSVVVVTESDEMPASLRELGVRPEHVYYYGGDYTRVEVLETVGIRRAASAILLSDTQRPRAANDQDARTVLAALTIERLTPKIFCCAQLHDRQHESLLRMAGVEEIVIGDWFTGVILGSVGRNQGLVAVLTDILTTQHGDAFHKVRVSKRAAGRTIGELHTALKAEQQAILVSLERQDASGRRLVQVNPAVDEVVQEGDVLVVISRKIARL